MNSSKKIKDQQEKEAVSTVSVPEKKVKKAKKISRFAGVDKKPVILVTLCIVVVLVLCIGVGIQQFKPKVIMTVNKTKITMDDMMYPIYEVESQYLPYNEMYETYTGKSIWEADYQGSGASVSGLTNAIGLKQEVLNAETQYELLYQYAKKDGYKLTKSDKAKAKKQAKKALKGLSWLQKLQLNISQKNLTARFEKRILANKYHEDKQKELYKTVDEKAAVKDISKKDYRQYDVQFYYAATTTKDKNGKSKSVSDKKKATYKTKIEEIAKKAKEADSDFDFTKLTDKKEKDITFEKDGNFTEKDGWSYVSADTLKKIKKMKNGEISDAILDDTTGYYVVVKMVNNNSDEAYKTACKDAIESKQNEAYSSWFEKEQTDKVVVNTDVWTDVTIGTVTTDIVTADDLNDMKENSSSSKKSSKGSNQ